MVGRADGGSFSIECFVSFEPLRSTSEDESLISLLAGDGQRFTALDIGRRTQRGIEIAAARWLHMVILIRRIAFLRPI